MNKIVYTHKGWFGLCPCVFADLDSEAPCVDPRWPLVAPLMWLSEAMFDLLFIVLCWMDDDYEPQWPLRITGTLAQPIERVIDER